MRIQQLNCEILNSKAHYFKGPLESMDMDNAISGWTCVFGKVGVVVQIQSVKLKHVL